MRPGIIPDEQIPTADPAEVVQQYSLWVKKLINRYKRLLEQTGAIGEDDLFQVGCMALLDAQKRYEPTCGASFLHYSQYYIRNAMRKALGIRSNSQPPPIMVYLDKPLTEESEETLLDTIPDDSIEPAIDGLIREEEKSEVKLEVRQAVSELKNEKQRKIISCVYFEGQPRSKVAEAVAMEYKTAIAAEHQGLMKLKRNEKLQKLVGYGDVRKIRLHAFNGSLWSSEEEDFILRQEKAYDAIYGPGAYVSSFFRNV